MADPLLIVVSRDRAGKVKTLARVPGAALCVPEAQASDYALAYPGVEILRQPDHVRGLAACRQWLYDTAGDVFMLDDDIVQVRDNMTEPGTPVVVPPERTTPLIRRLADTAEQLGVYLYGFASLGGPFEYTEHQPFQMTGWLACTTFGLRAGAKFWFRPDLSLVDDFWIAGLNAHFHRWCLIDRRYTFVTGGMFQTSGGLSHERTDAGARHAWDELRAAFGGAIGTKHPGIRIGGRTAITIQHEVQPLLHVPW